MSLIHTAYSARVLLQDVTGVCERNPEACAASRQAMVLLTRKLETGAGIFVASVQAGQNLVDPNVDHGTLTESDLEPSWSVAAVSR